MPTWTNIIVCKHPSRVGSESIYKMYKGVSVLELMSYHGLHTESEVTGGATCDK